MTKSSTIAAVVLAGGSDTLAEQEGVSVKALLDIAGKPMVSYVLEALQKLPQIKYRCFVGPNAATLVGLVDNFITPGNTLAESLTAGLNLALEQNPDAVLVVTGDLPWLNAEALEAFCRLGEADILYAAIPENVAKARFPEQQRTFTRFKEGKFTGGNVLLLRQGAEIQLLPFIDRLFRARKNPLRLASIVGLGTLISLALGRLSIPTLEKRASKILGLKARVFISKDATLGADVDKPEHLIEARKLGISKPFI